MKTKADEVLALANDSTKIIPGHGPLGSKADLKAYREMLASVSEKIKTMIKDGKTLGQVLAAKPTAEYDAVWGNGFLKPQKWVRNAVRKFEVLSAIAHVAVKVRRFSIEH